MDYIVSKSIFLPLLLLSISSCVCGHIPILGMQRRPFHSRPQQLDGLATFYYKQPLDHFNYQPQSYVTFDQRYIIDFKHWEGINPKTPIFAFLGAESDIDNDVPYVGFPLRFASRYKAMSVYLEHRFYGKSVPFGSTEKAMKNGSIRGHLNSAQALADYAELLLHIKKKFAYDTSPIIVMGASYGGMLASWFRLKYPHIALGALASSAPILYFDNITPQDGYYSVVSKSFKTCSEMVMPIGISGRDKNSMFQTSPFEFNEFKNNCKDMYGVTPRPHWITTFYGGQDLRLVLHRFGSNIIFSNGLRDPYSSGSVLQNISQSIVAITTAKGSHCLDIGPDGEDDPDWLIMQRKSEMDIVDGWISNYHADLLLFNQSVGSAH